MRCCRIKCSAIENVQNNSFPPTGTNGQINHNPTMTMIKGAFVQFKTNKHSQLHEIFRVIGSNVCEIKNMKTGELSVVNTELLTLSGVFTHLDDEEWVRFCLIMIIVRQLIEILFFSFQRTCFQQWYTIPWV